MDRNDRRLAAAAAAACAAALAALAAMGPEPALDGSSDGRRHTCGYVTEDGVTEHVDAYLERCADQTLGGDAP